PAGRTGGAAPGRGGRDRVLPVARGHDREEDLPRRHHRLGAAGHAGGPRRAPAVAVRDHPRGRDGRCERGREQSAGGQRPPAGSAEDQGGTIVRNSQATATRAHFTERPRRYEEPGSLSRPKLALLKFELPKSRLPFSLMCVGILRIPTHMSENGRRDFGSSNFSSASFGRLRLPGSSYRRGRSVKWARVAVAWEFLTIVPP